MPELDADIASSALLVEAACGSDKATEVERDAVTGVVMKLFRLANPAASALVEQAEDMRKNVGLASFASAARYLEADVRERLLEQLWVMGDSQEESQHITVLVDLIADCWGMERSRARAYRDRTPTEEVGA